MQLALHLHAMWPNAIPGNEVEQNISKLIWLILLQGSLCDYLTSQTQISLQCWKKNPIQHLIVSINKSGNNNIRKKFLPELHDLYDGWQSFGTFLASAQL